jgi:hypothetical protein
VTGHSGLGRKSVIFTRNERSRSPGIAGHVQPESVVTNARNTQVGRVDGNTQKSRLEIRREKWRKQFQAMSEDQREQLRARARQQYRDRVAKEKQRTPTAEESVRNWLEYRKSHGAGPTAEQSVQDWLAYRNGQSSADTNTLADEQNNTQWQDDRGLSL